MCGITASVALPKPRTNGHTNGHTNGYTNGQTNGYTNGYLNHTNEETNGHTNGYANGHIQAHTNGYTNGITNGYNNGNIDDTNSTLRSQLQASIDILNHRGPDESGIWISPSNEVALGHCRLSINDLSPSGRQPLHSDCGELQAVVNGEIYDFDRLRRECKEEHGYRFHGESDSELVLALYKIHGAPGLFEHLRGEFAFVLYDSRGGMKRVIAGRDRYGIKPMVYTIVEGRLLMAAEAKAFLPMGWKPEWDVAAIVDGGWQMDDRTLFNGVKKLLPGHWIELTEERGMEIHKYWDAEYKNKTELETRTIDEMVLGVRERLVESIRLRLRADVPVGIYLSGGIDSSAVAGIVTELAQKEHVSIGSQGNKTRVACFSVRFPESSGYDESHTIEIAERTAKWLGVETIKRDVDESTLAHDFADAVYHCEHHHWDLNFVAKFALSTLPREHGVKVVLTGEGADEHFAGYPYFAEEFLREPDLSLPDSPLAKNNELRDTMQQILEEEMKMIFRNIGGTAHDLARSEAMADANGTTMPETLLVWHPKTSLFAPWIRKQYEGIDCRETVMASHPPDVRAKMRSKWHPLHTSMYMWNKASLANLLLSCLGDRTEMAHSVEARTPFLDHVLTEYINGLPPSVKMAYTPVDEAKILEQGPLWKGIGAARQSITEKWILREAVKPYITKELYERRKHPFLAPTRWPKNGALHQMFKGLLTREAVEGLGFVEYSVVESALDRAFDGEGDSPAFRTLLFVSAWVTLAERFGVQKANENWRRNAGRTNNVAEK
ncbi:glutamine-hydrolyzing asparagine synthase [Patellaria atrata CBS 101060]|uniref:Glutamine-hydrolyzing asparagine synthase n=1 Tax=Patellaria atrata CBS 101060 TaxID=1346257 RepID=A0A9P4SC83_9PEZI|nr:glutamine-hydrolyzing asparagine synthase [Patellaria atrata CBS 101060]